MKGESGDWGITRRTFVTTLGVSGLGLAASRALGGKAPHQAPVEIENSVLRLTFNGDTGFLAQIVNKLTNETITINGDNFQIIAKEFSFTPENLRLRSLKKQSEELVEANYGDETRGVVASYSLQAGNHFFEKQITVTAPSAYRLVNLTVSKLKFSGPNFRATKYPYQKNIVYFIRSAKSGLFTGVELPFDDSALAEDGTVSLAYKPSLKVKQGEKLESEPIFVGVYKRRAAEAEESTRPLRSESEAMVAMTSTIIGPPRHGIVALACGWWCEMEHYSYQAEPQVKGDMRSVDFLAECGLDGFTDSHPWSGETVKMNSLRQDDRYAPGPLVTKFLKHAKEKKMNVIFWPTMNNTHPWWKEEGKPFRSDRPDWLMFPEPRTRSFTIPTGRTFTEVTKGNCIANEPFWNWLMGLQMDGMNTGYFGGWVMDGDFFGAGGIVALVDCPSDEHDHLPGDSNYACERALKRMMAKIREKYPNIFIGPMCRPAQDLGIWSNRYADATFTLDEFGEVEPLPGLNKSPVNVMCGDKIRKWSRVRVHDNFFPHYLDQPQVFVAPQSMNAEMNAKGPNWPSDKIDYVMLSALSCSPTQLFYLPTKVGIPENDKQEIRKWLDWGRANIKCLQVRKDLPDPPTAGKVDGSIHVVDNTGLILLFNPNPQALTASFALDEDTAGVTSKAGFEVTQSYPQNDTTRHFNFGSEATWEVPPESAVVLTIAPSHG